MLVSDNPPRWAQSGNIQIFSGRRWRAEESSPFRTMPNPESPAGRPTANASISLNQKEQVRNSTSSTSPRTAFEEIKTTHRGLWRDESRICPARCLALCAKRPTLPADVFVASATDFAPVQISRVNGDMKLPAVGRTEVITLEIERWKTD